MNLKSCEKTNGVLFLKVWFFHRTMATRKHNAVPPCRICFSVKYI